MKCYFTIYKGEDTPHLKKGDKVLIPGCYGSMHRDDLDMCTCRDGYISPEDIIEKLKRRIKKLEKYIQEFKTTKK